MCETGWSVSVLQMGSPPPSQRDALEMSGLATRVCGFGVLFLRAGGQVGVGTVTGFFTVSDQVVFAAGRSCKKTEQNLEEEAELVSVHF